MAAAVKTNDLKKAIKNILKDADLDSLSAKKVRRELEETFGIDLTERKKEIDKMTMELITEGANDKEEEEEEEEQTTNNGHVQNGKSEDKDEESGGDSDSSFDEPDPEPVVKKKKVQKAAPKPKKKPTSDGDHEMEDAELAKRLQEEEDMNLRSRRRPQKKPPAPRKPKGEKKERKGNSMYSKPCQLSPELAAVLGEDKMSRHEIVKRMWAVMRERDLQDPKNRQFMLCDEELHKIFGRKRVRMFGMMKCLTNHIWNSEDLVE